MKRNSSWQTVSTSLEAFSWYQRLEAFEQATGLAGSFDFRKTEKIVKLLAISTIKVYNVYITIVPGVIYV